MGSIKHIHLPTYQSKANNGRVYHAQTFLEATLSRFLREEKCWLSKTTALLCTWWMIDEKLSGSLALISSAVNPVKSFPAESVIKETCFPLKETFQAQGLWDSAVIITVMFPLFFSFAFMWQVRKSSGVWKKKDHVLGKKRKGKIESLSVRRGFLFFFFFFSLPGCDLSDIRCQVEQRNRNSPR